MARARPNAAVKDKPENPLRKALMSVRERHATRDGAVELVYWTVRDAIRSGVVHPGDRLIEESLAAALDMSRTPVREALRRLEVEHLVEKAPRRGLVVPKITLEDIFEIYEINELLLPLAARRAAQRMSSAELEVMAATIERMERAMESGDMEALDEVSAQFHRMIESGSKNARLRQIIEVLRDSQPGLALLEYASAERIVAAVREHRAIYEAIAARDMELAERLAREHVRNALHAKIQARQLAEPGRPAPEPERGPA